jgi:hypothetical protein
VVGAGGLRLRVPARPVLQDLSMFRFLFLLLLVFSSAATNAQEKYPSKALRVIVPFAPGSGAAWFVNATSSLTNKMATTLCMS